MFGADLERMWGKRKFYTYYFLCGVGAGLINVIVKLILDPHLDGTARWVPTIGASGAIYGVLLAVAVVMPEQAGVGVSAAGDGVDADFCGGDGRDRIFRNDWRERRQREPRLPSGRNAGGVHLFAARLVFIWVSEYVFGLAETSAEKEIRGVRAGE